MAQTNLDYVSFIGTDSVFSEGKIRVSSDLKISGIVEMDIESQGKVVVTESGKVRGNIEAVDLQIHGVVEGYAAASRLIMVSAKGKVKGAITAKNLTIEDGAVCNIEMVVGDDAANRFYQKAEAENSTRPQTFKDNEHKDVLDIDWKSLRENARR